jgi:unsaturated rhamnogalacturonyl hydrolase
VILYTRHLRRPTGLLRHAYDEQRDTSWADPSTGQSPEHWCRALGWFAMTNIEVLELLPATHPQRNQLLADFQGLMNGVRNVQDPETGLFFQVVDKGSNLQNWHETSCSSMFAYTFRRGVQRGYLDASFQTSADRARAGVLTKVSRGLQSDAGVPRTNISNITIGTDVGNLEYYLDRARPINDMHGLGAFLIMENAFKGTAGWNP